MCLSHPKTIPYYPGPWTNCVPWNRSLVPKKLGTAALKFLETTHLCPHFDINLVRPVLDFWPQKPTVTIHSCCCKPPWLWYFVIAPIKNSQTGSCSSFSEHAHPLKASWLQFLPVYQGLSNLHVLLWLRHSSTQTPGTSNVPGALHDMTGWPDWFDETTFLAMCVAWDTFNGFWGFKGLLLGKDSLFEFLNFTWIPSCEWHRASWLHVCVCASWRVCFQWTGGFHILCCSH